METEQAAQDTGHTQPILISTAPEIDQRLTRKPEEAGQILGIGRNGVYELLRNNKLRSIKVGRKILIPLSAIEEFLAGNREGKE